MLRKLPDAWPRRVDHAFWTESDAAGITPALTQMNCTRKSRRFTSNEYTLVLIEVKKRIGKERGSWILGLEKEGILG
jgi:hypothetical protein